MLSSEASAEAGRWYTDRAPYQREIMNAFSDPLVETVTVMSSAQIGKTEIINNTVGFFIDQDPSPILVVEPTLEVGKSWSKDRFATMIRDTPCFRGTLKKVKSKESGSTILHKTFYGGHLTVAGANSPASLRARPIRIVLCDDIDSFPASAGVEGDPIDLAFKRATTFWNRKKGLFSTPTIKGASRIEMAYNESDQKKFYVPCPHCQHSQIMKWGQVKWPKGKPREAWYECEKCSGKIIDADKIRMLRLGEWRAEGEFTGIAGFWLNELYSPWVSFGEMADRFIKAKGNKETLKVFVNTSLAETWEEEGVTIDDGTLYGRREKYGPKIPLDAGVLTAGVDVQEDRLECEVVAWGIEEESWNMDYRVFYGNPAENKVWSDIDSYLQNTWEHESTAKLRVVSACIDTGYHTKKAYAFVRPRQSRRVFAVKGFAGAGKPLVGRPSAKVDKVKLFPVGVDTAKDSIFSRLKINDFGPGYMHFPLARDEEYFQQLTAENIVTRFSHGFPTRVWEKIRPRNEALDARVYAMAALAILNPNLKKIVEDLRGKVDARQSLPEEEHPEEEKPFDQPLPRETPKQRSSRRSGGGWMGRWRR